MGLVGFFRTILILLAVYYLYKFFTKFLFPLLLKRYVNKVAGNRQQNSQFERRNGDVTIKYNNKKDKKVDKDKGEYVDYEEVN
jgi:hypothetical protein